MKNNKLLKITILDIIKISDWKDIYKSLMYHYPEGNKILERNAFEKLKKIKKSKHKDNKEFIELSKTISLEEIELIKKEERDCDYYQINTNKYSLSFRKWKESSNIPISKETLERYTLDDILAHFLWEITFYGDEEEMTKTATDTSRMRECCFEKNKNEKSNNKSIK